MPILDFLNPNLLNIEFDTPASELPAVKSEFGANQDALSPVSCFHDLTMKTVSDILSSDIKCQPVLTKERIFKQ